MTTAVGFEAFSLAAGLHGSPAEHDVLLPGQLSKDAESSVLGPQPAGMGSARERTLLGGQPALGA